MFDAFPKMETRSKEYKRARIIYKFAIEWLPRRKIGCTVRYVHEVRETAWDSGHPGYDGE